MKVKTNEKIVAETIQQMLSKAENMFVRISMFEAAGIDTGAGLIVRTSDRKQYQINIMRTK